MQRAVLIDYEPQSICEHLQYLFALLQNSKRRYIDPSGFVKALGLDTGQQQVGLSNHLLQSSVKLPFDVGLVSLSWGLLFGASTEWCCRLFLSVSGLRASEGAQRAMGWGAVGWGQGVLLAPDGPWHCVEWELELP